MGQIIRWLTGNKLLLYPEQKPSFQCPSLYTHGHTSKSGSDSGLSGPQSTSPPGDIPLTEDPVPLETPSIRRMSLQRSQTRGGDLEKMKTRKDLEHAFSDAGLGKGPTLPVVPQKLENGTILVDWYDTDDPENPQNWSSGKKAYVAFLICAYTFTVYMGSAIYSPSQGGVMERFGVGPTVAALGLALYVLAYGIGPLIFSPMSEIPAIGRNSPYVATFVTFVILCVPTALVDSIAGLLVLRFLQGFFGSPCLATGGASMGDKYSLLKLPYLFVIWAIAATCAPALGPIISGFSVSAKDWHWALWEILWSAGPVFLLMFFTLPETSLANILLRRAHRLRVMTGNKHLRSQSEIDQANLDPTQLAVKSFLVPTKIIFLDPAVAFADLYMMLIYGIFYSFFECFSLVYVDVYHFNLSESGLIFLTVIIEVSVAAAGYAFYVHCVTEPDIVVDESRGL
ncbi:MAG: hypothetical protein M1835_007647 [Candelina submexicana]|nr:MAG: hypothetical protein M1835_007647 [Candelina submexicana]